MPKFNPLENFSFTRPTEWPEWKQRFTRFQIATKLTGEDEEIQISSLIYAMGPQAEGIFKSFAFSNGDERKYKKVMEKFDKYFVPKKNVIHERAKFHIRCQRQGESVEEFVRNLHELAAHCEFRDKDDQIRDRLVVGILDNDLSEKLQLESELTLVKAVDMARNSELVKNQIKDLQSKNLDAVKVRQYGLGGKQYGHRKLPQAKPKDTTYDDCGSCKLRHRPGNCPEVGRICLKCGNKGHFKAACRGRPKRLDEVQDDEDEDETDDSF